MIDFTTFHLILCFTNLARKVIRITSNPVNLSIVPSKYHKFADIFSKVKVETLALYCLYNLQIKLENREKPSIETIYLLLTTEQEILKELIQENLNMGFIWLISSSHRVLVLFVKKNDSLHLCINFWGLNYITWKNKYLYPWYSTFLTRSRKHASIQRLTSGIYIT